MEESTFAPADLVLLEELRGAWADGDRVLVRRLIERIRGGSTDRRVLEAAEDYRRRLEGLEISERLSLGLRAGAAEGDPSRTVVELIAENADPRPVTVNLLTPTLERRLVSISPLGLESRRRSDDVLPEFEALVVPGEGRASVTLGDYPRASGGIASRERYSLDPAGAWLSLDGELLPVEDLPIASDSRTGIAPFLPSVPVEPSVLIAYLDDAGGRDLPDEVFLPALLERAVRIHPTRREEAVALLGARIGDWDDALVARAAPALRWVTGAFEPGSDPRAWRRWFAGRSRSADPDSDPEPRPALLIPRPPADRP